MLIGKHKTSKSGSFLEGEPAFKSLQEELMYKKNNLKKMSTVGTDDNKEVDKAKTSELGINIKDLLNAKKC